MNKQEQIAALKETIAKASRQIEELEKPEVVVGDIIRPKPDEEVYCIKQAREGKFYIYSAVAGADDAPTFTNPKGANRWAEMLNVMMELRACKGAVKPEYGKAQYYVEFNKNFDRLYVALTTHTVWNTISCLYETEADALAAIETVGKQRILDAARTSLEVI